MFQPLKKAFFSCLLVLNSLKFTTYDNSHLKKVEESQNNQDEDNNLCICEIPGGGVGINHFLIIKQRGFTFYFKVETKKLYEDQETASVMFLSFLDLAEKVLDQQTIILQNQESFMEQYGYITYGEYLAFLCTDSPVSWGCRI